MAANAGLQFVTRTLPSTGLDGAFRIHILPEHLDQLGLRTGDLCSVTDENGEAVGYGIAWRATDKMGTSPKVRPVKVTEMLKAAYGIKDGSHVHLNRTEAKKIVADEVTLTDVTPSEYSEGRVGEGEDDAWRVRCAHALCNGDAFATGATFDVSVKKGLRKRFYVDQIKSAGTQPGPSNLYRLNDKTEVVFTEPGSTSTLEPVHSTGFGHFLNADHVGGLLAQIEDLNNRLERALTEAKRSFRSNKSILIHGFEGTGKSLLLDHLEQNKSCRAFRLTKARLNSGSVAKNVEMIRSIFGDARMRQPSLILIDDINQIAPNDDGTYVETICEGLRSLQSSRVQVIGTSRSPMEVHSALLSSGRFTRLVELLIPDERAREQILKIHIGSNTDRQVDLARLISTRTHGYTGKDLAILVEVAEDAADDRFERRKVSPVADRSEGKLVGMGFDGAIESNTPNGVHILLSPGTQANGADCVSGQKARQSTSEETLTNGNDHVQTGDGDTFPQLTSPDFDLALSKVRPTALREIIFEPPKTTWSDIGGSEEIQKRFDTIIQWPLEHGDQILTYDKRPKRGVLLYGPPGCSKTLTAQAIATKYSLNFIAIKGGELISMYVGESERAVRDLFRKARAAKPCVIFFDEVDSIASVRESSGSKGLNVLTTLLTEMDGFNNMEGVLVLAATNKPEILDPAIMRPGRFDAHLYLGVPNKDARKEILRIRSHRVPGAEDLDYEELSRSTDGFTGAEIAKVYDLATDCTLERNIRVNGSNGKYVPVTMEDFQIGISRTGKGVSPEMLAGYEAFGKRSAGLG